MPTKNPRIQVVLEKPLYYRVRELADRDGLSLSLEIRSMVREAVSPYTTVRKPYTGKNSGKWVGKFGSGSRINDPDDILSGQVHG